MTSFAQNPSAASGNDSLRRGFQPITLYAAGLLFLTVGLALGLAFLGTAILRRYTDVDFKTAWFSAAIGGASEMANLAERHGARIDRVATAHSVRVLLVVVTVPFIFQWWGVAGLDPTVPGPREVHGAGLALLVALTCVAGAIFMKLRLPNPWVLGPMLVAMILTASSIELSALPAGDAAAIHAAVKPEVLAALTVEASVASRTSYGGTAPERVRQAIAAARAVLEPVHSGFDEGFATRDLVAAAELLAALE